MHPIHELKSEHGLIHRVLDAIDSEAARMQVSFEVRLGFWLQALDFLEHYADQEHHGKEKDALWPLLATHGMSLEHGPLHQLIGVYDQGRAAHGRMVESLASQDVAGLAFAATSCTKLLRKQFDTEEHVMFPLACELLDDASIEELGKSFAKLDRAAGDEPRRLRALATTIIGAVG